MKKLNFSIVFALFLIMLCQSTELVVAQTDSKSPYSKGANIVSAGIGLGSSIAGYTYGSQSPAISL